MKTHKRATRATPAGVSRSSKSRFTRKQRRREAFYAACLLPLIRVTMPSKPFFVDVFPMDGNRIGATITYTPVLRKSNE